MRNLHLINDTASGKKKVKIHPGPKDLIKYICCEQYYSRTIDEVLPFLHVHI